MKRSTACGERSIRGDRGTQKMGQFCPPTQSSLDHVGLPHPSFHRIGSGAVVQSFNLALFGDRFIPRNIGSIFKPEAYKRAPTARPTPACRIWLGIWQSNCRLPFVTLSNSSRSAGSRYPVLVINTPQHCGSRASKEVSKPLRRGRIADGRD